eukprot:TRINITY_DN16014_c0_g1_i1.p1 TRINITY_DN16014_c0_g1~~TRINITY_DN16014_c0_g1_i1.p1  ORF type:complete len:778 (+),score=188.62 TRINITY_DN16014_c0_g1_i1:243-2336(+)
MGSHEDSSNLSFFNRGPSGNEGHRGPRGNNGKTGTNGFDGYTVYNVVDSYGQIIESNRMLYLPEVTYCEIRPVIDDGIIEPQEIVEISQITVKNSGKITLPAGLMLYITDTSNFEWNEEPIIIPAAIPPDGEVVLKQVTTGRIGPLVGKARFAITPQFMNRRFPGNPFRYTVNNIAYPVCFVETSNFLRWTLGDQNISLAVSNLSTMPCGGVGRELNVSMQLCPGISLLDVPGSFEPNSKLSLEPQQTSSVDYKLFVHPDIPFYEQVTIVVRLHLRNLVIETLAIRIQIISPYLPPLDENSVLIITGPHVHINTFRVVDGFLKKVGYNYSIWDCGFNNGLSFMGQSIVRHENTWMNHYLKKNIIWLTGASTELNLLDRNDLIEHFSGPNASLFIVGNYNNETAINHILTCGLPVKHLNEKDLSEWYTVKTPNEYYRNLFCNTIVKEYENKETEFRFKVNMTANNITLLEKGWTQSLYSYGTGVLLRSPISIRSQFVFLSKDVSTATPIDMNDMTTLLSGLVDILPLTKKLQLLCCSSLQPSSLVLPRTEANILPQQSIISSFLSYVVGDVPAPPPETPDSLILETISSSILFHLSLEFKYSDQPHLLQKAIEIVLSQQYQLWRSPEFLARFTQILAAFKKERWDYFVNPKSASVLDLISNLSKFLATTDLKIELDLSIKKADPNIQPWTKLLTYLKI